MDVGLFVDGLDGGIALSPTPASRIRVVRGILPGPSFDGTVPSQERSGELAAYSRVSIELLRSFGRRPPSDRTEVRCPLPRHVESLD